MKYSLIILSVRVWTSKYSVSVLEHRACAGFSAIATGPTTLTRNKDPSLLRKSGIFLTEWAGEATTVMV